MSELYVWPGAGDETPAPAPETNTTGLTPKATVAFTLHVHLDDGTIKDIPCVGEVNETPPEGTTP